MGVFVFVVIVEVTAEDGEQTHGVALTLWAISQMASHFNGVLGHDEFVDFLSLLWSSFFVTLVAKKYRLATMLPFVPRMVCDSR